MHKLFFCVLPGWQQLVSCNIWNTHFLCPLPGWQRVSGLSQELGVLLQLDHLHELVQDTGAPVQAHELGQQCLQQIRMAQQADEQLDARAFH